MHHNPIEAIERMEPGSNPGLALAILGVVLLCGWFACTKRGR